MMECLETKNKDSEADHLKQIQEVYEELKKGKVSAGACRFHSFDTEDKKVISPLDYRIGIHRKKNYR